MPAPSTPLDRWTLLYDADCDFCKWVVSGILAWDRHDRVAPRALQSAEAETLLSDLSPEERLASVHLIAPDGRRFSAGSVVAPLLRLLPGGTIPALGIARLPRLTNRTYDWVADHRSQLSRAVPAAMKRRARLPDTAHTRRPWRIHELTRDFRLEDVWALPTPGGPDDFPRVVQMFASGDPSFSSSGAVRRLFAIRWKVGALLGWDGPDGGQGSQRPTLRDRFPADLRDAPSGPDFDALPFTSLYLVDDEWAAEIVNRTVHGVMHIGWVRDERDGYRGEMAVYVKPNGLLGTGYMAAIRPFRHLIVYPPMLREMGRRWRAGPR